LGGPFVFGPGDRRGGKGLSGGGGFFFGQRGGLAEILWERGRGGGPERWGPPQGGPRGALSGLWCRLIRRGGEGFDRGCFPSVSPFCSRGPFRQRTCPNPQRFWGTVFLIVFLVCPTGPGKKGGPQAIGGGGGGGFLGGGFFFFGQGGSPFVPTGDGCGSCFLEYENPRGDPHLFGSLRRGTLTRWMGGGARRLPAFCKKPCPRSEKGHFFGVWRLDC